MGAHEAVEWIIKGFSLVADKNTHPIPSTRVAISLTQFL